MLAGTPAGTFCSAYVFKYLGYYGIFIIVYVLQVILPNQIKSGLSTCPSIFSYISSSFYCWIHSSIRQFVRIQIDLSQSSYLAGNMLPLHCTLHPWHPGSFLPVQLSRHWAAATRSIRSQVGLLLSCFSFHLFSLVLVQEVLFYIWLASVKGCGPRYNQEAAAWSPRSHSAPHPTHARHCHHSQVSCERALS